MHEMSIVMALLDQVRQEAQPYADARIQTVRVRIGALRNVVPEMLTFAFAAATRGSELEGCRLEVDWIAAEAQCDVCSLQFPVEQAWFECPRCQSLGSRMLKGDELHLVEIGLETASQPVA